jgi:uncharacterized membrane protein (UPF0127 family)
MPSVIIKNLTRPLKHHLEVGYCEKFIERFLGLMFHPPLGISEGILLVGKQESRLDAAIHMLFMRMDLAVVWMTSDFEVVDVKLAKAWRPVYIPVKPAQHVLEISAERIADFQVGDHLQLEDS